MAYILFEIHLACDAVDNVQAVAPEVVLAWLMSVCHAASETLICHDQLTEGALFVGAFSFDVTSVGTTVSE